MVACLDYNAGEAPTPVNGSSSSYTENTFKPNPKDNYQKCLTDLENSATAGAIAGPNGTLSSSCALPPSCNGLSLGRSLAGPPYEALVPGSVSNFRPNLCGTGQGETEGSSCLATPNTTITPGPELGETSTTTTQETCCTGFDTTCKSCQTCAPSAVNNGEYNPPVCTEVNNCDLCGSTTTCGSTCEVSTTTNITYYSADCNPAIAGSYANWVQNSLTLFAGEQPKFAARAQYLSDMYTRAKSMQSIFTQGAKELNQFICSPGDPNCPNGSPSSQLLSASTATPTANLPNSVIYGWLDDQPSGGSGGCTDNNGKRVGCAHIVKVTAYAPGRGGNPAFVGSSTAALAQAVLPYIKTSTSWSFGWFGPRP